MEVSAELLTAIRNHRTPTDDPNYFAAQAIDFSGSILNAHVDFQNTIFQGPLIFHASILNEKVLLNGCTFPTGVHFHHAHASEEVTLAHAAVKGPAALTHATFRVLNLFGASFDHLTDLSFISVSELIWTQNAIFHGAVNLRGAQLGRSLFAGARFLADADLSDCNWVGDALFNDADRGPAVVDARFNVSNSLLEAATRMDGVRFRGPTHFDHTRFREIDVSDSTFHQDLSLQEVEVARDLVARRTTFLKRFRASGLGVGAAFDLSAAVFEQPPDASFECADLRLSSSSFVKGGLLRAAAGTIDLAGADAMDDLLITGAGSSPIPKLVSLERSDAAFLTLAELDLAECRFIGAHHLEDLRIEPTCSWRSAPKNRWWTQRHVLADEAWWRASQGRTNWSSSPGSPVAAPDETAAVYRSLRRGFEKSGDVPGAADFYYGEMEMRRHGNASISEKAILFLYWLLSGYGMRALRAFAALLLVLAGATYLFHNHGFGEPVGVSETLAHTVATATIITAGVDRDLTTWGEAFRIMVRLLSPLLIGLAILAVRERVKR